MNITLKLGAMLVASTVTFGSAYAGNADVKIGLTPKFLGAISRL